MAHSKHPNTPSHRKDRDHFFDDCFSFDGPNEIENRHWSKIDEFKGVPDLVKKGDYDSAWFILDHISNQYTDYNFIYAWKATILQKKKDYRTARGILSEGLKKAKSTHLLCERMGHLEFECGDINDAVMWWVRSVVLMSRPHATKRWEALLYLAYIAMACGCASNHKTLMAAVSQISIHGRLALESEAITLLEQKIPELAKTPAIKALDHLCVYYLKNQIQSEPNIDTETGKTIGQPPQSGDLRNPIPKTLYLINPSKKASIYLGGVLFVIFILFLFYYFNSDQPIKRPLDKSTADMDISTEIEAPKQEVPTEAAVIEKSVSDPASVTKKRTSRKTIESTRVQTIYPSDMSQPDKPLPDNSKIDPPQAGRGEKTGAILEKKTLRIDHKKRYPGLQLKTKTPKPVRIQKEKTED